MQLDAYDTMDIWFATRIVVLVEWRRRKNGYSEKYVKRYKGNERFAECRR